VVANGMGCFSPPLSACCSRRPVPAEPFKRLSGPSGPASRRVPTLPPISERKKKKGKKKKKKPSPLIPSFIAQLCPRVNEVPMSSGRVPSDLPWQTRRTGPAPFPQGPSGENDHEKICLGVRSDNDLATLRSRNHPFGGRDPSRRCPAHRRRRARRQPHLATY